MLLGELNVVVVVVFFVVVAAGVRIVNHLTAPGPLRPRTLSRDLRSTPPRAPQRAVSLSPVEKRKPTPGSVST
jgi:hypothetical protein